MSDLHQNRDEAPGVASVSSRPARSSLSPSMRWDLTDLYESSTDPRISQDEAEAWRLAEQFAADYRGKIAVPGGPAGQLMAEALARYEALLEKTCKLLAYAGLLHAQDTQKPEYGALLSRTQDLMTRVQTKVMFFELDWLSLSVEEAAAAIDSPRCRRWRHFLKNVRRFRPHMLSEPEEIILAEKQVTGVSAFRRLFDELSSSAVFRVVVGGEEKLLNQSQALALLYESDREKRIAAHEGFTAGLQELSRQATFILNATVRDHHVDMRLRGYEHPADYRHLTNETDRAGVEALMQACESGNPLVQQYYSLKRELLGLDHLYDYDRYAPVAIDGESIPACTWEDAREIVQDAYDEFSPVLGQIVRDFFEKGWIDAEPRPAKRAGAFSHATVPSVHPYILINFMGKLNNVMTLAHELGHGVHQFLSRRQGILQAATPLTLAETASVFGEMLVFDRLIKREKNPKVKLALYSNKLEDTFATVFRQAALTRFEERLHAARAEKELSTEEIDQLWLQANAPMHGDAVSLTDGYKRWWSYIAHFIRSPFYCYAYSFGELMVLSLWSQYRKEGASFVPKYLDLLKAGGSDSPANLIGSLGLDVKDPRFWEAGISVLADLLEEAKVLAKDLL